MTRDEQAITNLKIFESLSMADMIRVYNALKGKYKK